MENQKSNEQLRDEIKHNAKINYYDKLKKNK